MNVKSLVQGLSYLDKVDGKRQTYHVFRGEDYFLVLSFSKTKPQAGNFNIVDSVAVEYVRHRFRRKKAVTSNDVVAKARRSRHVPGPLAALNILYVLAALGDVKVDARRVGPKLYFNFKRGRA
ncbi:MAG: hypothetical protein M3P18_00855 [Actinomycetota bacterium]|nr:hypothetical protein [Actinomycetota bacterium]